MREPKSAKALLRRLFDDLPDFDFGCTGGEIDYIQPTLRKPAFRRRRLKDRADSATQHSSLSAIFGYLLRGTGKLEYGVTSDSDWIRYMRFPSDRMPLADGKHYGQSDFGPQNPDVINWDAKSAKRWLTEFLIPKLQSEPRTQIFVLGDPGAGKSTLIKYLLNTNHNVIRDEWVIFSRFEYLKFKESWWDRKDIQGSLDKYLSYIMLRDAIHFYAYDRSRYQKTSRMDCSILTDERFGDLMFQVAVDLNLSPQVASNWHNEIQGCIQPDGLNLDKLRNIPHDVRASLLSHLDDIYENSRSSVNPTIFCVIMDGLDYISIDDFVFNNEQHELLAYIMSRRSDLTNFRISHNKSKYVRSIPMFVMRGNTFDHFNREREIDVAKASIFQVAPIDPEVTIYNAILRASDLMVKAGDLGENQRDALVVRLFRSIAYVMASINKRAKIGKNRRAVYGLFGYNIRTQMEFIHKLFITIIDEAMTSGTLKLIDIKSPFEIIDVIDGEIGRRIIKRRRYRLIELLLFSYIPWFETAIIYSSDDDDESYIGDGRWCRDNPQFTGVVDNVFNYTTTKHPNDPDQHCFLEKVRIIQSIMIAESGDVTPTPSAVGRALAETAQRAVATSEERYFPKKAQILKKMRELSGYVPRDFVHSLYMLMRTEMIVAHVGGDGTRGYAVTPMGRAVVSALCRDMSYIEHIFHGTLLPRALVEGIEDEYREKNIDTWTVISIRNAFIWLSYLRFVENKDANSVKVIEELRLWSDTQKRVLRSIDRILDPSRNPQIRMNQERVAELAVAEIKKLTAIWARRGVVRKTPT